jgi:hypothetical protein
VTGVLVSLLHDLFHFHRFLVGTDGSFFVGLGAFGVEGHAGIGIGNGLGQLSGGGSYSHKGGIDGGDATIKLG